MDFKELLILSRDFKLDEGYLKSFNERCVAREIIFDKKAKDSACDNIWLNREYIV